MRALCEGARLAPEPRDASIRRRRGGMPARRDVPGQGGSCLAVAVGTGLVGKGFGVHLETTSRGAMSSSHGQRSHPGSAVCYKMAMHTAVKMSRT